MLCVHVCMYVVAKWLGYWPANGKVAGSISAQDTLVLFP